MRSLSCLSLYAAANNQGILKDEEEGLNGVVAFTVNG